MRSVIVCHCTMCQRVTGSVVMATQVEACDLRVEDDSMLTWFSSSPGIRRGFCSGCGSNLFWQNDAQTVSVTLGTLDPPVTLPISHHVHVASSRCLGAFESSRERYESGGPRLPLEH
ncbi:MAG: GFA family protein [Gammaproteobacteria bacterium]